MLHECETKTIPDVKSMDEVWEKIQITTTVYATLLICEEILKESDTIDQALNKIDEHIKKIRLNNSDDFVDWLKRYLHLY